MSDAELDAIEARANAATLGPWRAFYNVDEPFEDEEPQSAWCVMGNTTPADYRVVCRTVRTTKPDEGHDAEFMAAARQDVPALVAEVRRRNAIERLEAEDWAEDHTHLQNLCREIGKTDADLLGDEEFSPAGIQELGNMLAAEVRRLRETLALINQGARRTDGKII